MTKKVEILINDTPVDSKEAQSEPQYEFGLFDAVAIKPSQFLTQAELGMIVGERGDEVVVVITDPETEKITHAHIVKRNALYPVEFPDDKELDEDAEESSN